MVISQYWRREIEIHTRLLGGRWQLFHITPIGYGLSDRVPGYAGEALHEQVLAVLDRHGVERFAIWGYSAGGAMAACVARATKRAAGLVCGGFGLFDQFTPGALRQLDRRLDPDHASRSLWWWVNCFDWASEVENMCPCLLYWGSNDRQFAKKLRRSQRKICSSSDVDFVEFPGLDHGACATRESLEELVVPTIEPWLAARVVPGLASQPGSAVAGR